MRGSVWLLSAVISVVLQWVALTVELARMLSHVLVSPLRVRGRTSLLSASITFSHTHTHILCPLSRWCTIHYLLHICTQTHSLRLSALATCLWYFLFLALLHSSVYTTALPGGPCDLPCLPHLAPVHVRCQFSHDISPWAVAPSRLDRNCHTGPAGNSCQHSQHHHCTFTTFPQKAAPAAFT